MASLIDSSRPLCTLTAYQRLLLSGAGGSAGVTGSGFGALAVFSWTSTLGFGGAGLSSASGDVSFGSGGGRTSASKAGGVPEGAGVGTTGSAGCGSLAAGVDSGVSTSSGMVQTLTGALPYQGR